MTTIVDEVETTEEKVLVEYHIKDEQYDYMDNFTMVAGEKTMEEIQGIITDKYTEWKAYMIEHSA